MIEKDLTAENARSQTGRQPRRDQHGGNAHAETVEGKIGGILGAMVIERCVAGRDRRRRSHMIEETAMLIPGDQERAVGADLVLEDGVVGIADQHFPQRDVAARMMGVAATVAG